MPLQNLRHSERRSHLHRSLNPWRSSPPDQIGRTYTILDDKSKKDVVVVDWFEKISNLALKIFGRTSRRPETPWRRNTFAGRGRACWTCIHPWRTILRNIDDAAPAVIHFCTVAKSSFGSSRSALSSAATEKERRILGLKQTRMVKIAILEV